jgi:hypothetical protein
MLKDTWKWELNLKVECAACPVTGVYAKLPNGLWAAAIQHWDPEYKGYWHIDQKMVFPLQVRLVSGSGAVGEQIEETIQEMVNDKLIEGTKQFKRCNALPTPAPAEPAFDCSIGVCVTPATMLHTYDYYGPPGGQQSVLSEATCREACTLVDGCTYSSYCPPSDPACVLATDDMNEALISTDHVRRCILYGGCSSGTLRPANSNSGGDVVPYVTCPRDTHYRMVEAGCTDTLDPSCEAR